MAAPLVGAAGAMRSRVRNIRLARSPPARSFSHASSKVIIACSAGLCGGRTGALLRPLRHVRRRRKLSPMPDFTSIPELRALCLDLPAGHPASSAAVAAREATLTKPPKSLGRLEDLVAWLAHWQGRSPPRLHRTEVLI